MAEEPKGHLVQAFDLARSQGEPLGVKYLIAAHLAASIVEALVLIARSIKDLKR